MAAGDKLLLDSDVTDNLLLDSDVADVLLLEAAAGGAVNPKGVFGLALQGPFGGPIG